jgi:hypothetical protein
MKLKSAFLLWTFPLTILGLLATGYARDIVIPAGTLLRCTIDEPNFSSATADIGDPILCHPRSVQQFGQAAFPRGTYLVGHLESAKNPGHFWGKGNMKLEFDRIGLPNNDISLPGKIVAVHGYKVDKEGKIIGKGHPKRDIVEWMLPPLWPWKVLMLPARGPRPALKGETAVTMRIMDDVVIPENALGNWHRFGQPTADAYQPSSYRSRQYKPSYTPTQLSSDDTAPVFRPALSSVRTLPLVEPIAPPAATTEANPAIDADITTTASNKQMHYYGQRATLTSASAPVVNASENLDQPVTVTKAVAMDEAAPKATGKLTLLVLRSGTVYAVTDYWIDNNSLSYTLARGGSGAVSLDELDWGSTTQLNSERGVHVTLRSGQPN